MLTLRVLALILLPVAALAQTPAKDPVNDWIRGNAVRLATPVVGHGFDDMQPLKKIVGDARIVALGEATHGSREFFQLKHRVLEFLATQMGFTIFSIEANMPEAYKLNDFVLNGNGDPAALIKGMYFWTWDTQEVLDMVLWMREFNQSGKGRVTFTGFDMQTPTVAARIVRDFVDKADPEYAPALADAVKLALAPSTAAQPKFGTANAMFPVDIASGKTIHFSGFIKTENVSDYAGFWWRADVGNAAASFSNLRDEAPKGTTDWQRFDMDLVVPKNTTAIYFGLLLAGSGTAWFDDLQVEIDGKPYTGDAFDFTFEGPSLRGFHAAVPTFPTRLDTQVAHSGKQSLRISHVDAPENRNAVDPRAASAEWKRVIEHLSSSRETYAKTAGAQDIEWAIQNARVVRQCMDLRANDVPRDTSMAENVKWILDQSPEAKIVLWAHNGHVSTSGVAMGATLRKMYGDRMVVFGFAFNQGGFQSIATGRGLRDFTVPPTPHGTLGATLAAAGIPLFALDLRAVPKSGPVGDWFHAAHATRSIGSMYPEDSPYAFVYPQVATDAYDALLFVETTTPARKNPGIGAAAAGATPVQFAVKGNEYRDPEFAVSVTLPQGWSVGDAVRWGDREVTANLKDARRFVGSFDFQKRPATTHSDEEAYAALATNPESKAKLRTPTLPDYRVRPDSIQRRTVGGRPALSCIADYTSGQIEFSEYLTWISGENAGAQVFASVPRAELESLRHRLDPIIDSVKLP